MKKMLFSIPLMLFLVSILCLPSSFAQDYTTWGLPEGARVRLGKGKINEIRYSPDGTQLAVATAIGIWIYDVQTGEELHLLQQPNIIGLVESNSVSFSPDGRILAGGTFDLHLWHARTGEHLRTLDAEIIQSLSFSPDGQTLASAERGRREEIIRLLDVNTGEHLRTLKGHTDTIRSVSFSPNGRTLASGSSDGTVRLWDARTGGRLTLTGHTDDVNSVSFSPDGQTLASGSDDGTVRLWDARTGAHLDTIRRLLGVDDLSFSPDGQTLAIANVFGLYVWHMRTRSYLRITPRVNRVAFSPDGQTLATSRLNSTLRLLDPRTGEHLRTLTGHTDHVNSVSFSPDGQTLASSGSYPFAANDIHLWDTSTGELLHTFIGHRSHAPEVSFSPDGQTLASCSFDRTVRLWNPRTGKHIRTLTGHADYVLSVSFSPDGRTLASGSKDNTVRLWDARTGRHLHTLTGHTDDVLSVSFSPDGQTLASGSDDKTVRLWDARTGRRLRTLTGHTDDVLSVSFSPDGQTLASGSRDKTVRLWDARTGRHLRTLTKYTEDKSISFVYSVSFSPDGQMLAVADGIYISLWDAHRGTPLRFRPEVLRYSWERFIRYSSVNSVSFSPDGQTLASSAWQDGTVLLWDVPSLVLWEPVVQVDASQRPPMYWIDAQAGTLHRLVDDTVENLIPSLQNATHLAVDAAKGKLYWTEKTGKASGEIRCADLKNANVQLLKKLTSIPLDIALDTVEGKLYLTNSRGKIQRLNVDGSSFHAKLIAGLEAPEHLTLDLERGQMYWTEKTDAQTGRIRRANLDGTNVELIKDLADAPRSMTVDPMNRKIYLTTPTGKIQRMNLNGSGFNRNFIKGLEAPGEIAIDIAGSKLYWMEAGNLRRADLKGDNIEDVVLYAGAPSDIAFGIAPVQGALAAAPAIVVAPDQTSLLANYPNPFNPETWIPYQLATSADVTLTIYDIHGRVVRALDFGHQRAGMYHERSRAAYWDGRNAQGEPVASGVYFYTFTAGDFTATRKMLIRK